MTKPYKVTHKHFSSIKTLCGVKVKPKIKRTEKDSEVTCNGCKKRMDKNKIQ